MNGKLIIFSAPSGSGKTTVVNYLLKQVPDLAFSISATTRAKRPGEVDGKDYYFLSQEEFEKRLGNGEFLEHEEVYHGLYYGTLKSEVDRIWSEGKHVIFDVDVKGGVNIKKNYGDKALAVFLRPPSIEVAMERLKKRATEVEHEMKERIDKAMFEMGFQEQFDVTIVNDVLEETFEKAITTVKDFINKP